MSWFINDLDPKLARAYQGLMHDPEMAKALTAGTGTDAASFTGGRALQFESLELTLNTTTFDNDEFLLWNMLPKSDIAATVDQWNDRSAYGEIELAGQIFGQAVAEAANPLEATATIARETKNVAYYRSLGNVSHVAQIMRSQVEAIAEEEQAATMRLMRNVELDFFNGDSSILSTHMDGLNRIITAKGDADQIISVNGALEENHIQQATTVIRDNYGRGSHMFHSLLDQNDLDLFGQDKARIIQPVIINPGQQPPAGGGEGIWQGTPARGYLSEHGYVRYMPHVFLKAGPAVPASASTGSTLLPVPAKPVLTSNVVTATTTSSFTAAQAGDYLYQVVSISPGGYSLPSDAIAAATVGAGDYVTLTITPGDANAAGFLIFRSSQNGLIGTARFVKAIARTAGATTTWVDNNLDWPGTTRAYIITGEPRRRAIDIRRLFPLLRFDLAITAPSIQFLVMFYMYLRVMKPKQHVMLRNIVSSQSDYAPFS